MKYTNWILRLLDAFAGNLCWGPPIPAQSVIRVGSPTCSAMHTAADATDADDPQTSMITLHARVNEVNLLFIATDKHGKFVRDLNQDDFSILDDHKPPQAILNFRRETDFLCIWACWSTSADRWTAGLISSKVRPPVFCSTRFGRDSTRPLCSALTATARYRRISPTTQLLSTGVHKLHSGGGTALTMPFIARAKRSS